MTAAREAPSGVQRCPACGQPFEQPAPPTCPLCAYDFYDDRVTGLDVTPYARLYAREEPGWRVMCEWVWYGGGQRLKHLALMRRSVASRRFTRINVLLVVIGLCLLQATECGWHFVTNSALFESSGTVRPSGRGWLHVAAMTRPLPPSRSADLAVDLWWNPVHLILGTVVMLVVGWFVISAALLISRLLVTLAHKRPFRQEQRMMAAIDYSTAWYVLLLIAAGVSALKVVSYFGVVEQWPWYPPERALVLSAGVFAALGCILWWFWLIRLGATAPARTRFRVFAALAFGAPLCVCAAGLGLWVGLSRFRETVFPWLQLEF